MKFLLPYLILILFTFPCYCQLKYSDLNDLYAIAKKEDFNALKTFLVNNGYSIKEIQMNYDHGSYYLLGHIDARKEIGNLLDGVDISLNEYDDYKKLTFIQICSDNREPTLRLNLIKYSPFKFWLKGNWTFASILTDPTSNKDFIGNNKFNDLDTVDTTLEQIPSITLDEYLSKKNISEKDYFSLVTLLNNNPCIGELKHEELTFFNVKEGSLLTMKIENKIFKGQDINTSQSNKTLHIPLQKLGKTYLVTIRFGKLLKTYILDSGASDMSIDEETVNYFENNNQLKIENRLTNAK